MVLIINQRKVVRQKKKYRSDETAIASQKRTTLLLAHLSKRTNRISHFSITELCEVEIHLSKRERQTGIKS